MALLRSEGRNLVLTDAGVAALHEADHIFALGEQLPQRVREATSGQAVRLNLGISDGIAKLAVHRLLTPVLDEPHLRLLCHDGEFQPLLAEPGAAQARCGAGRPLRPAQSRPAHHQPVAGHQRHRLVCAAVVGPRGLAELPAQPGRGAGDPAHRPRRAARSHRPLAGARAHPPPAGGEFEDSALLSTFAAAGMGVMPAPLLLGEHLQRTYGLEPVGTTADVHEHFHLIYSARKVIHPLVTRLAEAGAAGLLGDAAAD